MIWTKVCKCFQYCFTDLANIKILSIYFIKKLVKEVNLYLSIVINFKLVKLAGSLNFRLAKLAKSKMPKKAPHPTSYFGKRSD